MLIFILGTLAILLFLAVATFRSAQLLRAVKIEANLLLLPVENLLRLTLVAACIFLGRTSRLPIEKLGWLPPDPLYDILTGIGIGLAIGLLLPLLTNLATRRLGEKIYSDQLVKNILPRHTSEWFAIPVALLLAVSLEEILFRSLLLGGFSVYVEPWLLAVMWSVVFGAMHLPQGWLGMIVAGLLGLVFSALFLVSSSLWLPLVAHYVINLTQIVQGSLSESRKL